jgi:hypothetical protein
LAQKPANPELLVFVGSHTKLTMNKEKILFAMQHNMHLRNVCKWTMDLRTPKWIILHRVAFNTFKVIIPHNMRLGDDSMAKAIGWRSTVTNL